jgi:hypothetical protein
MRGKQHGWSARGDGHPEAGGRLLATPSSTPALPTWESFPVEDRHRLVSAILQAARRQVETRPVRHLPER